MNTGNLRLAKRKPVVAKNENATGRNTSHARSRCERTVMDSMLEKTVLTISHTLGIGMVETYLLIGAVLLFTVYKIIDLA
jgi:hypothetical protein